MIIGISIFNPSDTMSPTIFDATLSMAQEDMLLLEGFVLVQVTSYSFNFITHFFWALQHMSF